MDPDLTSLNLEVLPFRSQLPQNLPFIVFISNRLNVPYRRTIIRDEPVVQRFGMNWTGRRQSPENRKPLRVATKRLTNENPNHQNWMAGGVVKIHLHNVVFNATIWERKSTQNKLRCSAGLALRKPL